MLKWLDYRPLDETDCSTHSNSKVEDARKKLESYSLEAGDDLSDNPALSLLSKTAEGRKESDPTASESSKEWRRSKMMAVFDDSNTVLCMDRELDTENVIQMSKAGLRQGTTLSSTCS